MQLNSLHALYIEQLQDLYSAETQLVNALPKMVRSGTKTQVVERFVNLQAE